MEVLLWTLHYNLNNVSAYPVDSLIHMKALHMMEMHIILPYQMLLVFISIKKIFHLWHLMKHVVIIPLFVMIL